MHRKFALLIAILLAWSIIVIGYLYSLSTKDFKQLSSTIKLHIDGHIVSITGQAVLHSQDRYSLLSKVGIPEFGQLLVRLEGTETGQDITLQELTISNPLPYSYRKISSLLKKEQWQTHILSSQALSQLLQNPSYQKFSYSKTNNRYSSTHMFSGELSTPYDYISKPITTSYRLIYTLYCIPQLSLSWFAQYCIIKGQIVFVPEATPTLIGKINGTLLLTP